MRPSLPRVLLHLEGAAALALALVLYARTGWGWPTFALLLLAPDLSMLGYLAGPRAGSVAYNAAHTYVAPAALAALSPWWAPALPLALVWAAHVGMDRLLGYGLKYPTGFKDTHLART